MRRKPGELLPIETGILGVLADALRGKDRELHGFAIAKDLQDRAGARRLTAHGTLYKALDRLDRGGMIESRWEDPELAAAAGRPRRRLYTITGDGQRALDAARASSAPALVPRPVTT